MQGLSFLVPTLDEAGNVPVLGDAIRRSERGREPPFEIVVADHDPRDGTAEVARELGARRRLLLRVLERSLTRVRVIELPNELHDRPRGKSTLHRRGGFEFLRRCTETAWKKVLGAGWLGLPSRASTAGRSGIGKESS